MPITPIAYQIIPDPADYLASQIFAQLAVNQPATIRHILADLQRDYDLIWNQPIEIVQRIVNKCGPNFLGMCQAHANLAVLILPFFPVVGIDPSQYSTYKRQADSSWLPGLPAGYLVTPNADPTLPPVVSFVPLPSGYSIAFDKPQYGAGETATLTISGATVGMGFSYTILDSHGDTVTGSGTIVAATEALANVNLSTLADGGIQVSLTLQEANAWGRSGSPVTATAILAAQPAA